MPAGNSNAAGPRSEKREAKQRTEENQLQDPSERSLSTQGLQTRYSSSRRNSKRLPGVGVIDEDVPAKIARHMRKSERGPAPSITDQNVDTISTVKVRAWKRISEST